MDRTAFFAALRSRTSSLFGTSISQSQVNGIEGILDAFASHGDGKRDTLAYALATAYHETGRRMVPVREGFASSDAGARAAVNNLAKKRGPNSAVAKYAKPQPPYGHVYYGRGHVQLTWLDNYGASSADAGTDLVKNPDAMLDPVVSARVLIKGLLDGRWNGQSKGLRFYLDRNDLRGARRTVNALDKADEIAGYHRAFLVAINAAGPLADRAPEAKPHGSGIVKASSLNLRDTPNGKVIGSLAKGGVVAILERGNGWLRVRTPREAVGWVSATYIAPEPVSPKPSQLLGIDPLASLVDAFSKETPMTNATETTVTALAPAIREALTDAVASHGAVVTSAAATAVTKEVAAVVINQTNQEPWYQSRVTWGALGSILLPILGVVGVTTDVITLDEFVALGLAAGTTVSGLLTLYGRWVAKKPIGQ